MLVTRIGRPYILGISLSLCSWSNIAFSQEIGKDAVASPGPTRSNDAAAESALGEIVVTAQKREESLQKIPITISAFTAETLASRRIDGVAGLQYAVPGIVLSPKFATALPTIRGVGNDSSILADERPVAVYLDGAYLPTGTTGLFNLTGIEQIAVLKGPQGTLFGRNAEAGAIQIVTRDPNDQPYLSMMVGYGNHDAYEGNVFVNLPIANNFATNFEVYGRDQRDGYGQNLVTGNEIFKGNEVSIRNVWMYDNGDTSIRLSGLYADKYQQLGSAYTVAPGYVGADQVTRYTGFYDIYSPHDPYATLSVYHGSLKIKQDIGWGEIASITAYSDTTGSSFPNQQANTGTNIQPTRTATQPSTRTSLPFSVQNNKSTTQELQYTTPNGSPITIAAGLFYFHAVDQFNSTITTFPASSKTDTDSRQIRNSIAAYLQGTANITSSTRITVGSRYSIDKVRLTQSQVINGGVPTTRAPLRDTFKTPTWRVAVDQDLGRDALLYASWNRGYKAGIFNLTNLTNPPIAPENLDAYEAGLKLELFDRHVRFNVAGFINRWRNIQVIAVQNGVSFQQNAGAATAKGVDIAIDVVPLTNLTLYANAEFLRAKYTSFPNAVVNASIVNFPQSVPIYAPLGGSIVVPALSLRDSAGNQILPKGLTGFYLPQSPKFSGTVGGNYKFESAAGDFSIGGNIYYNSGYNFQPDASLRQKRYARIDGTAGWTSTDKAIEIRLWVRNLTNHHIIATAQAATQAPGEPRMFGTTVRFNIGK